MGNSLLDIKPHQVSRNLRGYSVLFYGEPKSGKTTTASQFPGALVLAFEKGYLTIPGIMAKDINSWGEFRKTLRELDDPDVKNAFQTIVIDTADIAYGYCEKYVCSQASDAKNSYENIADIPFGKGYKMAQAEFDVCIRKILQMNYGLVLISHSQDKTFKDAQGVEFNQIVPTLDNRARLICERTCDIIGYSRTLETAEGKSVKLFMRETPRFVAGSRFKYTPDVIDFSYDSLVNAIADAIDKEANEHNNKFVTNEQKQVYVDKVYDFEAIMKEIQSTIGALMAQGSPNMRATITGIVETHLGKGKKVSDCVPDQAPILDLILFDLKKI
jgi:DNA polymerase III delta prime subunit